VKALLLHRRIIDCVHLVSSRLARNLRNLEKRLALNHTRRFLSFVHFQKSLAEIVHDLQSRTPRRSPQCFETGFALLLTRRYNFRGKKG